MMRKLKVVHLIEALNAFGGTPRKLLYLAASEDRRRCEHVFVTYRQSSLAPAFERCSARIVNLNTLSLPRLLRDVTRIARREEADVIATHYTRPLLVGWMVARRLRLPWIHNEHSSAHYRRGLARHLARFCLGNGAAVVCNSRYTADTIGKTYWLESQRLQVIYNPVEPRAALASREATRAALCLGTEEILIGHIGGMIATRDQGTLIHAFAALHAQYPHVRLVLIGDGPRRAALETLATALGIDRAVRFLGYTDRVGDQLAAIDVYVNPTLNEGFGIAVVEAMLAGLPVVLADRGAHPELIDPGHTGLLYRGGDSEALAQTLRPLIEDEASRRTLGAAARAAAAERFAPARYAAGYRAIVTQVVQRQGVRANVAAAELK